MPGPKPHRAIGRHGLQDGQRIKLLVRSALNAACRKVCVIPQGVYRVGSFMKPSSRAVAMIARDFYIKCMDVNEKIVEEWARLCRHQFTMANIRFKVPGNYSDIDILAYDPREKAYYDYEVKWRSVKWVGATPKETVTTLVRQLKRSERRAAVKEIIGGAECRQVFVTTEAMLVGKKEDELRSEFASRGVEIISFERILDELFAHIDRKQRYDSEVPQLMRMMKIQGYKKVGVKE